MRRRDFLTLLARQSRSETRGVLIVAARQSGPDLDRRVHRRPAGTAFAFERSWRTVLRARRSNCPNPAAGVPSVVAKPCKVAYFDHPFANSDRARSSGNTAARA